MYNMYSTPRYRINTKLRRTLCAQHKYNQLALLAYNLKLLTFQLSNVRELDTIKYIFVCRQLFGIQFCLLLHQVDFAQFVRTVFSHQKIDEDNSGKI